MDIVLIGGLWLGTSAWDAVLPELETLGHRGVPVALPVAVGDTLEDQVDAVLAAVDAADRPVVVGHSAACTLAWLAADRRPTEVRGVVMLGGFPTQDGQTYADFFPITGGVMPFPGWGPFAGPDAGDLDAAARKRFEVAAVDVPEGVAKGVVRLTDDRRLRVPVTVICPEFSPAQAQEALDGGHVPALDGAAVTLVDLDSGHWPMFSEPAGLARLLGDV